MRQRVNNLGDDRIGTSFGHSYSRTVQRGVVNVKQCKSICVADSTNNGEKYCAICLEDIKVGDSVSWSKILINCR